MMAGTGEVLVSLDVVTETDVFIARQFARDVAAAIGFDRQDQVRLATALSEVGRDLLSLGGARVEFRLPPGGTLAIAAVTRDRASGAAPEGGLDAARRLVDEVRVGADEAGRAIVTVVKRLPPGALVDSTRTDELRAQLAQNAPRTPLEELRTQNEELLTALEQLQAKQDELIRLNAELEETNRGVMALYTQLSEELEETNRGVVALYAELDEKGMQLQQVNEAKTRFLRNVSHELRTPVNSVLGLSRLLLDPDADGLTDEQREQVQLIHASGSDLLRLVNELLDLAKAEAGRLAVTITPVDVSTVARELRGTISPLIRDGVELMVEVPADLPAVSTDEALLRHVLRNLLSNAAKFTERGRILLGATLLPGGDEVALAVTDTGPGIAPEDQEKVFEEFYQVRSPLQAATKGTGLGLPFARRVVTQLGGTLTLDSTPGRGSTFTVRLPLAARNDSETGTMGA